MCFSVMADRDFKRLQKEFNAIKDEEAFSIFEERCQTNPKKFKPIEDQIFPYRYVVVLHKRGEELVLSPMRYGIYAPEGTPAFKDGAYNARKTSLKIDYWSESFGINHGVIVVLGKFIENVVVEKLLEAKSVTLKEVEAFFEQEKRARKEKVLAKGKRYTPTEAEKTETLKRKINIEFEAIETPRLYAPVVFSKKIIADGKIDYGCAIVTDNPHDDVKAAGHDRTPDWLLKTKGALPWLETLRLDENELTALLEIKPDLHYKHQLAGF